MEKSPSWSRAHDWKSCRLLKGLEGSNPSFSARKPRSLLVAWFLFFISFPISSNAPDFKNPMQRFLGLTPTNQASFYFSIKTGLPHNSVFAQAIPTGIAKTAIIRLICAHYGGFQWQDLCMMRMMRQSLFQGTAAKPSALIPFTASPRGSSRRNRSHDSPPSHRNSSRHFQRSSRYRPLPVSLPYEYMPRQRRR